MIVKKFDCCERNLIMNIWTEKSIELANTRNYLDELFKVYPISKNLPRKISNKNKELIASFFKGDSQTNNEQNQNFLKQLIEIVKKSKSKKDESDELLFPVKDSYVPYLKLDPNAIKRNPRTVNRLVGEIRELGLDTVLENMTLPKESNRQMGPLFNNWLIKTNPLGAKIVSDEKEFLNSKDDMVFAGKDESMKNFASKYLGYTRVTSEDSKGLDLLVKFNDVYVIGEAKFITDKGGHQWVQQHDALNTLDSPLNKTDKDVRKIAIIDGVSYISKNKNNKFYKSITSDNDKVILSALLLRDYLYSI